MTISHRHSFLAAAILGLGLVSCSKETEVKYQQDNYKPRDILVEKTDKSFTALNSVVSFDYSRQLVINEENTAPENKILNLVLQTTCRALSSASSSTLTSTWPNPEKIDVLQIIPTDILLHRTKEPVYCEIAYTSTNTYNSTNTGKVTQIKIENMDSFSNLPPSHPLAQSQVSWSAVSDGALVPFEDSVSTVVCDDFSFSNHNLQPSTTKDNVIAPSAYSISSLRSVTQTCRAVFKNKTLTALSPVFQLHLPVNPLNVEYSFSVRHRDHKYIDESHAIDYRITNPNPYPVAFTVNAEGKTFRVTLILLRPPNYYPSVLNEFPVLWSFNGQSIAINSETPLMVPAHSTSTLRASVHGAIDCSENKAHLFIGTNSDLNEDLTFQFANSEGGRQMLTPIFPGTLYPSPSTLKNWDMAITPTANYTVGGIVHWIRWGSSMAIGQVPNISGCRRTR